MSASAKAEAAKSGPGGSAPSAASAAAGAKTAGGRKPKGDRRGNGGKPSADPGSDSKSQPEAKTEPAAKQTSAQRLVGKARHAGLLNGQAPTPAMLIARCPGCNDLRCGECSAHFPVACGDRDGKPLCATCAEKAGFVAVSERPGWYSEHRCAKHTTPTTGVHAPGYKKPSEFMPPSWRVPVPEQVKPDHSWIGAFQHASTTLARSASITAAAGACFGEIGLKEGNQCNPHAVMAALRATREAQIWERVSSEWVSGVYATSPKRSLILVGAGPRQNVALVPQHLVNLVDIGANGALSDGITGQDVSRMSAGPWSWSGNCTAYWERVASEVGKAPPGSIVIFYNTAYYMPEFVKSILDTAVQRGVRVGATVMLPPSEFEHPNLKPAVFLPAYRSTAAPQLYEGVILRDGETMRVIMDGNSEDYCHPVPDPRWVPLRTEGGMAAAMWSPKNRAVATTPVNGMWFTTASGALWMPWRTDLVSATSTKTVEGCIGAFRAYYASARGLANALVPPALLTLTSQVAGEAAAARLQPKPSLVHDLWEWWHTGATDRYFATCMTRIGLVNAGNFFLGFLLGWLCAFAPPPADVGTARAYAFGGLLGCLLRPRFDLFVPCCFLTVLCFTWGGWPVGYSRLRRTQACTVCSHALVVIALCAGLTDLANAVTPAVTETRYIPVVYGAADVFDAFKDRVRRAVEMTGSDGSWFAVSAVDHCAELSSCTVVNRVQLTPTASILVVRGFRRSSLYEMFELPRAYPEWFVWYVTAWRVLATPSVLAICCLLSPISGVLYCLPGWWCLLSVPAIKLRKHVTWPCRVLLAFAIPFALTVAPASTVLITRADGTSSYGVIAGMAALVYVFGLFVYRESTPRLKGRTAAFPVVVAGVPAGRFEQLIGRTKRVLTIAEEVETALAQSGDKLKLGGFAVLSGGPIPPFHVFAMSTGAALRVRYFSSGCPEENDHAARGFRAFMRHYLERAAAPDPSAVVEFLGEHARKFSGAKREQYRLIADFIAGRDFVATVNTSTGRALKYGDTDAWMQGFTKRELTALKAIPEERLAYLALEMLASMGADEHKAAYVAALGALKPRMITFPSYVDQEGLKCLALIFASHFFVKAMSKDVYTEGCTPDTCCDLDQMMVNMIDKMSSLEVSEVSIEQLRLQTTKWYSALGMCPSAEAGKRVYDTSFCSKELIWCLRQGQPSMTWTIPFPRLVARALAVEGCLATDAPAVMNAKLDCLRLLCQGSAWQTEFLKVCQRFVARITDRRLTRPESDYERWTMAANSVEPHPSEARYWQLKFGAASAGIMDEINSLDALLAGTPCRETDDETIGVTTVLPRVVLDPATFPLFSEWCKPGFSVEEETSMLDTIMALSSSDGQAPVNVKDRELLLSIMRGRTTDAEPVTLVSGWLDYAGRGVDKNLIVCHEVARIPADIHIVIGSGRPQMAAYYASECCGSPVFCDFLSEHSFDAMTAALAEVGVACRGPWAVPRDDDDVTAPVGRDGAVVTCYLPRPGEAVYVDVSDYDNWAALASSCLNGSVRVVFYSDVQAPHGNRRGGLTPEQVSDKASVWEDFDLTCVVKLNTRYAYGKVLWIEGNGGSSDEVDYVEGVYDTLQTRESEDEWGTVPRHNLISYLYRPPFGRPHPRDVDIDGVNCGLPLETYLVTGAPRFTVRLGVALTDSIAVRIAAFAASKAGTHYERPEWPASFGPRPEGPSRLPACRLDEVVESACAAEWAEAQELAGLGFFNKFSAVAIDGKCCDGTHQKHNFRFQDDLIEYISETFPHFDPAEARKILFGPVVAEGGVRAWVGSVRDSSMALFSGLPWTGFINLMTFLYAHAGALAELTGKDLRAVLEGPYMVRAGSGDDSLAIVRTSA